MEVEITTQNEIMVITLNGQIDGRAAPRIQEQILQNVPPAGRLVLDMSRVDYMSSAGLRMLLLLSRQVAAAGSQLVLVGLAEDLSDTMAITGFLPFFDVYDSLADGLAALQA
jgi:anti-sigma B factor antagonist